MAFKQVDRIIYGSQAMADTSTVQNHPLGHIIQAFDSTYLTGEFIYLKGVASTVVGSFVTYDMDDGSTALLAANATGPVALAMSICVASNFGWYQISGKGVGKVLASFADNAAVYSTATAGSIDDAVVGGDRVHNAKGASGIGTPSAGLAEITLNRPHTDDIAD
jgi:hypothetical protein|tara:strand:+ start:1386 stop:1877 length:492 start_codon:yes stop_codon:yes gene_type:complete